MNKICVYAITKNESQFVERWYESMKEADSIYNAYQCCRKNKKNKDGAKKFEVNELYNLQILLDEINTQTYKLSPSYCFLIKDPAIREVFCADFRDRIVQHFVYNELNSLIDKELIYDTANCRVGKGVDFAIGRVKSFVRKATDNYTKDAYYLKMDLSGFFMSIKRERVLELVLNILNRRYTGKYKKILQYLLPIIILSDISSFAIKLSSIKEWDELPHRKTLFDNPNGLPIGNICSQVFANLYLSELDHLIKQKHKYYSRYVDDMIIVDNNIKNLVNTLRIINEYIPSINLKLNNNKSYIRNVNCGIPYLGVIINKYYVFMGKFRINKMYSNIDEISLLEDPCSRIACRRGTFLRYKGYNLCHRWINKLSNSNIISIDKNLSIHNIYQKQKRLLNQSLLINII